VKSLFADAPKAVRAVAIEHECGAVYWNREYELNERRRDAAVQAACEKARIRTRAFTDQTLAEPGEIRTGEERYFTVFTPFRRALYKALEATGIPAVLPRPRKQPATTAAPSPIPDRVEGFASPAANSDQLWPGGEKRGLRRLAAFAEKRLARYHLDRDRPALEATSVLSPYLAVGAISVRQCLAAALEASAGKLEGPNTGATAWINELAWREFYRHILVGYPRVCMGRAFKPETERIRWAKDEEGFRAWCEGRTGVPIVDAGMRQLAATGWMHNRVRMIAAMFLAKDLFIDWREGERFFMRHLIDGDLASNNGGWQWSASTGTDSAPYFRIFNPFSQSRACDPDGEYIRLWVPELQELEGGTDGSIHDPSGLPPLARSRIGYPEPIVEHSRARERVLQAFKAL